MPTTVNFKKLFGRSPFPPLKEHMKLAVKCVEMLPKMLEAMFAKDKGQLKELRYKIFEIETEADKVFDHLSSQLPQSMFMPVHRHDLIAVLRSQEEIADTAQDIAGLLHLHLEIPEELHKPLIALANKGVETCQEALKVVKSLEDLVETGFKGPDVERVHNLIDDVAKSEDGADMMGIDLTQTLYHHFHGKDVDAVSILFTYELIKLLGRLADHAELVGSRTRLLMAK